MKVWSRVLFISLCFVLVAGLAHAVGTDSWVDKDGFLQIPRAAAPPVLDGELDGAWLTAPIIKCDTYTSQDPDAPEANDPDDFLDNTVEARAMWDDEFFYFFARVIDDEISTSSTDSWMNDSFEIYFDGENNKKETSGYDDVTVQWRWVFDEAAGNPGSGTEEFAWVVTDYGYDFELKIPLADLPMPLAADHEFGFEIQHNDRDNEDRDHLARWWHTSNLSWNNASYFGNAMLSQVEVDEILPVYKTDTPFDIDGDLDDKWLLFPQHPQNTWVTDGGWDFESLDSYWYDCYMHFRVAYDDDYFYAFVDQADQINDVSLSADHEKDSVELYWDGDNSKGSVYDNVNDTQFRWVSDGVTGDYDKSTAAAFVHAEGFFLEVAVPWESLNFEPLEGELFGFEVQTNDTDDGVSRAHMGRWWSNSNDSWRDPSIFGVAVFAGLNPYLTSVRRPNVTRVDGFDLGQNYPNPFNPVTTIHYVVRQRENVRLTVYDMLGKEVATLVNEVKNIGQHEVTFNASDLASGNYFYRLEAGDQVITKKMTLLK
ncbi:MAG TPA: T9SS type A sorting domain-containing protein [bacterium]|nr:T9SS type A sorting domain-containing protein [bacterium]